MTKLLATFSEIDFLFSDFTAHGDINKIISLWLCITINCDYVTWKNCEPIAHSAGLTPTQASVCLQSVQLQA